VTDYRCELSFLSRENGTESESVDELVEEGNPFEGDVAPGGEHADNNEEEEWTHLRYCTTMFPDEYLAEEKWVWLRKRTTEWVLFEPNRPH
jgi:hypothetical protein